MMLFVVDDPDVEGDTYAVLNDVNELRPVSQDTFEMMKGWGVPVAADGQAQHPVAVIGTLWWAVGADVIGVDDPGTITVRSDEEKQEAREKLQKPPDSGDDSGEQGDQGEQ
jgi:hypothetical protein